MVTTAQFRKELTFELEGDIYSIIWFQHLISGPHAGAITRTKLKNIRTGNITERTFKPTDKFNDIELERKKNQFLYADGENFYFMDKETYEQISVAKKQLGKGGLFMKEEMEVDALYYKGKMLGVELPPTIEMKVIRTSPAVKSDSGNVMKSAVVENEVEILVPQFISEGETIRIDTHTDEYIDRIHESRKEQK